ncbi:hypothetical protein FHX81_0398 [Saccharothrix saharensis]|uniref:Uncharacterized protein n=1 Tax=Saccharothrix saharensis TaxID=571190 RepID=A0A543J5T9_9PSEU|nr:hypothetical protein FHX81_0398 [Saccharothrix saharensis]
MAWFGYRNARAGRVDCQQTSGGVRRQCSRPVWRADVVEHSYATRYVL